MNKYEHNLSLTNDLQNVAFASHSTIFVISAIWCPANPDILKNTLFTIDTPFGNLIWPIYKIMYKIMKHVAGYFTS